MTKEGPLEMLVPDEALTEDYLRERWYWPVIRLLGAVAIMVLLALNVDRIDPYIDTWLGILIGSAVIIAVPVLALTGLQSICYKVFR